MTNPALRTSRKVAQLASQVSQLTTAGRELPSSIKQIEVRHAGLKGGAGARHWSREQLPALKFANPTVPIIVAPKPTPATTGDDTPWNQPPGVVITFHDSPRRAFLPLPAGERSEKLAKRFWESMTEEGLRALGTDEPEPEATPKQVDALQVKREQDRTLPGEKGTPSES